MATVQHPASTSVRIAKRRDRLWIGLSVIIAILVAGAATWVFVGSAATIAALPAEVTGFEYGQEATGGRVASQGITSGYLGHNPMLDPDK